MSNLLQRAIIALTLGPLALYLMYLGGFYYFIPLVLILILATVEYVQLDAQIGIVTFAVDSCRFVAGLLRRRAMGRSTADGRHYGRCTSLIPALFALAI